MYPNQPGVSLPETYLLVLLSSGEHGPSTSTTPTTGSLHRLQIVPPDKSSKADAAGLMVRVFAFFSHLVVGFLVYSFANSIVVHNTPGGAEMVDAKFPLHTLHHVQIPPAPLVVLNINTVDQTPRCRLALCINCQWVEE